jgi:Mg-chelatase subunit ChlD
MPTVPVDVIPGINNMQSNNLIREVQVRWRGGGSTTTPALTGALQLAWAWQLTHDGRKMSVVFLTDGQPTGCDATNTVSGAATVAQMYAKGRPPIKTYVLGIGPDTGNLDPIAAAGGTQTAYIVTNATAAPIAAALRTIAADACNP